MDQNKILEAIESMSVKELVELTKAIEEKFGIDPAQFAMAAPAAVAADQGGAPAQEKTHFDVVLTAFGQKIPALKAIRQIHTDVDLTEAKKFLDPLPSTIKEGAPKEEAEKIKKTFEEIGATVELQ